MNISSECDSEATFILTSPCIKGIVIGSQRKESYVNLEKKRKRSKYETPTLFSDKMLKEKFNSSWVEKKVIYRRYIDLLEIKANG